MRLLIMGPPGAGKGTQAALLANRHQIPAISTGDIFRAMQTADTPLAEQVRAIMAAGGYVTDDITNAILADRLGRDDCQNGFLLDGYPRTLDQVTTLDALLAENTTGIDAVLALQADTDEVVARLLRRATTENRPDDDETTIRVRQQIYTDQTEPLLTVYRDRQLLVEVDALGSVDAVASRLEDGLRQHLHEATAHPGEPEN